MSKNSQTKAIRDLTNAEINYHLHQIDHTMIPKPCATCEQIKAQELAKPKAERRYYG